MLSTEISETVLTIGCAYKHPKGGVAHVLYSYDAYLFKPFHFVVTTRRGGKLRKLFWLFIAIPLFVLRCLSSRIKIVHVHGASYNSFYRKRIFIDIAKRLGKKVVYHIHGGGFADFYKTHTADVAPVLKKVDAVIALSDSWKLFFESEASCKRVVVVPNIIPFHNAGCKESNDQVECLFLGAINKNKGIYDMLDVLNMYQEDFRGKLVLHIGGLGEQDNVLNIIHKYGLTDIVCYEGFVDGTRKNELLGSADFFVLPSYIEGLPISILEAMSYGLPILSTSVGGIPEIVEDGQNGILITPGDRDSLYHAMLRLMSDSKLRRRMGTISYQKVQPHFPNSVSNVLEMLYKELL